ncbi:DUF4139 domain-containing protein [Meridianimaribacter flavus]|uniref:Uncharacterized protein (TIGR02231 family) n=1 Tax=Meridianimaribacter flavus TaxID=571115 RepID=A0ABY2G5D0_9FLAO|nr:DUF4139 domain-containing protein [Meridianimaribacter flavus]TDY12267.1 uncharacterized protein (TIGR02231 family) [Meridianimaribacter flavus]
MKNILLLFFIVSTLGFANKKNTSSTIKEVTVYLNGAQITRTTTVSVPVGTTEFVLDNLSPNIQESSIQVSGLKQASVLSINYGINYLTKKNYTKTIDSLQTQKDVLYDKIQIEDQLISGYNEELFIIQNNRKLSSDTETVSLEKVKAFANYYRTRITEINALVYKSEKQKKEYNASILLIQKQLQELNVDDKVQTGEISLKLNSAVTEKLNLIIKYNVTNAGWFPIYDLKAEKINAPINLQYKAHVYQTTGIEWDDVKLTLSTSDPTTNNLKPDVNTKFLNFISPYSNYQNQRATKSYNYKYNPMVKTISGTITSSSDGLPLPGVNVIEQGTTNGTQTDFDGNYTLRVTGESNTIEYSYVGMQSEVLPIHSSTINVSMQEDVAQLDEIVVTGYANTRIRGNNSVKKDKDPLYIVDGVPMDAKDFNQLDQNSISNINILKDASATSIYGSRAENGVILVTTKRTTSNGDFIDEGITNTRFEIQKNYTITSNGDITVIEIDTYSIDATYSYFAAPVINENVFLTAKIGNWEQYNLLPAEANVYFEGSYSGTTNINPYATTDSLTVSLGVDPNVAIKRSQNKDFKKNAFIGSNKIITKNYDIELKNNKPTSIDIVVLDRIPISQNKDIKVDDIETGISNYDKDKGIMEWKLKLSSNESKKLNFGYTLKYPKYKRINM